MYFIYLFLSTFWGWNIFKFRTNATNAVMSSCRPRLPMMHRDHVYESAAFTRWYEQWCASHDAHALHSCVCVCVFLFFVSVGTNHAMPLSGLCVLPQAQVKVILKVCVCVLLTRPINTPLSPAGLMKRTQLLLVCSAVSVRKLKPVTLTSA